MELIAELSDAYLKFKYREHSETKPVLRRICKKKAVSDRVSFGKRQGRKSPTGLATFLQLNLKQPPLFSFFAIIFPLSCILVLR